MGTLIDDIKYQFSKSGTIINRLIIINVVIFLLLLFPAVILHFSGKDDLFYSILSWLILPGNPLELIIKPWTLITSSFIHLDIFHILFNMLFLYSFGNITGSLLGERRIISLYLWGGIIGGLVYVLFYNFVPYFQHTIGGALHGASASVFAIALAATIISPDYEIGLFFYRVKIKYVILFYLVLSIAQTMGQNAGGSISHLGGALAGWLFVVLLRKGIDPGKPFFALYNLVSGKPKMKITYRNFDDNTIPSEDEVNAILDKIAMSGYESLTKEEKQKLFNASKK